jgi:hypothetical protein
MTANFVQVSPTPSPTPTPTPTSTPTPTPTPTPTQSPPTSKKTCFSGFLSPLKEGKTHNAGCTIPVKFRLSDSNGDLITSASPTLWYAKIVKGHVGTFVEAVSTSKAATENKFRIDSEQFIFNFSTKGLREGEYQLKVVFGDGGAPRTINIVLR